MFTSKTDAVRGFLICNVKVVCVSKHARYAIPEVAILLCLTRRNDFDLIVLALYLNCRLVKVSI